LYSRGSERATETGKRRSCLVNLNVEREREKEKTERKR
jgi:hypothetical protein